MFWSKSRFIIDHRNVVLNLSGRAWGCFSLCSEAQEAGHPQHGQRDKLIEQIKIVMLPVYHSKIPLKEDFQCGSNGGEGSWEQSPGQENGFCLCWEGRNRSKQGRGSSAWAAAPGQNSPGHNQVPPGSPCTAGTDPQGWAGAAHGLQ